MVTTNLPLSPWVYEIGNSLIASLALCLVVILGRFFATEVYHLGWRATYDRARVKLALAITALVVGEAAYRTWTWWGRYCANSEKDCIWMTRAAWPFVPGLSIAVEVAGLLCLIRVLAPGVWGSRAWVISAGISVAWSMFWFSGWDDIAAWW